MRQCCPHLPVWPYGERPLATLTQAAQLAQDITGSWPGQRPPLKSLSGGSTHDPLDSMSCFPCPRETEAEDGMPAAHAGRVHSLTHSLRCGLRPGPEPQGVLWFLVGATQLNTMPWLPLSVLSFSILCEGQETFSPRLKGG